MTEASSANRAQPSALRPLARARWWQLRNLLDQQIREAPWRTLATAALLLLIWFALYLLLDYVLGRIRTMGLIGVVAHEYLFAHFFVVLAVMLAFSNGILTFGSLYGRDEAAHLLCMPADAREIVTLKWVEGVLLSSWSFILLGVPLMFAVASNAEVHWYYYPLFLAHFMGFVTIPACLGALGAWAVAMYAPRRPITAAIGIGAVLLLSLVYWIVRALADQPDSDQWFRTLLTNVGAVRQPLMPSTWSARGIITAMEERVGASVFYLLVVLANGFFLAWLTINVLARSWPEAFSRAQHGRIRTRIRSGWITAAVCNGLFFYLPYRLRQVMLKDVRAFARDARQWSQMLIMFGLLVIYALNLKRLPIDSDYPFMQGLIAFLNLTTVSLILATFTSRFVYPLLSLESQQLWLIELLPVPRSTLLLVKFLFALTVTTIAAVGVMAIAVAMLALPPVWIAVHLLVCVGVCAGLSGLSIGLGARFPVLTQRNPARIASGFGGTFNLVASMVFVAIQMAGVALLSIREFRQDVILPAELSPVGVAIVAALTLNAALITAVALWVGIRHFERLEY